MIKPLKQLALRRLRQVSAYNINARPIGAPVSDEKEAVDKGQLIILI
jgi:hypothetical protein